MNLKSPLSQQAKDIYSLLLDKGPMSATQIGKELTIFPHAVYRSTKQLRALGCMSQTGNHPARFEALPVSDSVEIFALLQKDWFLNTFLKDSPHDSYNKKELNISFIESREMLFEKALLDIQNSREEMNNLASGD